MIKDNKNTTVALVMGLQDCGLGVIRSLAEDRNIRIIGFGGKKDIGKSSRYLESVYLIDTNNHEEIRQTLLFINDSYEKIIPIPAGTDKWVTILFELKSELTHFIIDYGDDIVEIMSKEYQAEIAAKLDVPYPKSRTLTGLSDIDDVRNLRFPVVVKPITRNKVLKTFRILSFDNFNMFKNQIEPYLEKDKLIVSEFIEGDDSELYTYGSYAKNGSIVADFIGRKLFQRPPAFGVAGIAENLHGDYPFIDYAKRMLKELRYSGISQVEFKRDPRNGKYYLTEINPRSWLWMYLATKCGANLPTAKYYTLTDNNQYRSQNNKFSRKMYVSEKALLYFLIKLKSMAWFKIIIKHFFSHKKVYSIMNIRDIKPFFSYLRKMTISDD